MARRLGLPVRGFVAATNRNDVVPEYLRTGIYRERPSRATISNAMDVGAPSNFERILALYDSDLDRIRAHVVGSAHTDDETRDRIASVYQRYGYVLDPHAAVGHLGLDRARETLGPASPILLATAHPAKFREVVEPVIGSPIELPSRLAACLDSERGATSIPADQDALRAHLLSL